MMGPQALTTAELLAILVGSGSTEENAVQLMQRVMHDSGDSLALLGRRSWRELSDGRYKGLGPVKAVTLAAAAELSRRREMEKATQRQTITTAMAVYSLLNPLLRDKDTEEFWVVMLNQASKLIGYTCVSRGGLSETAVDLRVIAREACLANATIIAVAHNHPSGSIRPSRQDNELTQRIKQMCGIMRLHLLDHVIIGDAKYYSYHEEGQL
jgi:DNA repair protein RadC